MRQVPDDRIDPRRRASLLGREGPTVRERHHDPCDPLCVRIVVVSIDPETRGRQRKNEVARYGQSFKDRAVARLLPPESVAVQTLARELSISAATLARWRAEALSQPVGERGWSAGARFEAVLSTAAMDEASKGAWCRGLCNLFSVNFRGVGHDAGVTG